MIYEVEFSVSKRVTVRTEASSAREAVELASQDPEASGMTADYVEEVVPEGEHGGEFHEVVGHCEACGKVLFHSDEYNVDNEAGHRFCLTNECSGDPDDIIPVDDSDI